MNVKVRIFWGDELLTPSALSTITICNPEVDRIVNRVVDQMTPGEEGDYKHIS